MLEGQFFSGQPIMCIVLNDRVTFVNSLEKLRRSRLSLATSINSEKQKIDAAYIGQGALTS